MAAVANLSGGPVLLSFSLATGTFALSTTFVRFCTRASISTGFVAADYASLVATLVALIGTVFGVIEATSSDPSRALEFSILGQPWYLMSVTLSKISICLFFMKLLGRARQWRILLSVLIVFMAAVNFAFSLTVNLQCRPLEKLWNPSVDGGCWNPSVQRDFGYFQGAFSLFTWFFLAFFPALIAQYIPKDRNPTWPFYVSSVLSFASGIFAIIRTAQTSQTSGVSVYTLHYFYLSLMAHLEQNFGLISANVLAFGPLFSRRRRHHHHHPSPNQYSSSSSSSGRSNKRPRPGANPNVPQSLSRSGSSSSSRSIATTHRTGGTSDSKRSSKFIIQGGAATDTDDPGRYFSPQRPSFDSELELDLDIDNEDVEAWPRGIIIKTVSVEVVEEVNPDHYARQAASRPAGVRGGLNGSGNGNGSGSGNGKVIGNGNGNKNGLGVGVGVGVARRNSTIITVPAPVIRKGQQRQHQQHQHHQQQQQVGQAGQRHQRDNSTEVGGEMDWETILRAGPPR